MLNAIALNSPWRSGNSQIDAGFGDLSKIAECTLDRDPGVFTGCQGSAGTEIYRTDKQEESKERDQSVFKRCPRMLHAAKSWGGFKDMWEVVHSLYAGKSCSGLLVSQFKVTKYNKEVGK